MLNAYLQFLPSFVCLAALAICLLGGKARKNPYFVALCVVTFLYFYVDAGYVMSSTEYLTYLRIDLLGEFVVFLLVPLVPMFLYYLLEGRGPHWLWHLFFLPSAIIGPIYVWIYFSVGPDTLAKFVSEIDVMAGLAPSGLEGGVKLYYLNNYIANRAIMLFESATAILYIAYFFIKSYKREGFGHHFRLITLGLFMVFLISFIRVAFGRSYFIYHQSVSAFLCFCLAAVLASLFYVYLRYMVDR